MVASGWNGALSKMDHCAEPHSEGSCQVAVHSEEAAVTWAARIGTPLEGTELYCTHNPCYRCARMLVTVGVARVLYAETYRDFSGTDLLQSAGVEVDHFPLRKL